jgi:hypothetical protein
MNDTSFRENNFNPRIIVWNLSSGEDAFLSTQECLLTIESIARLSKPIIVFTGSKLTRRSGLYDIVEYGTVLGLKMIIEVSPSELTQEVLDQYAHFGPKIFRLIVDGCIIEDPDTRFRKSPEYAGLRGAIERLKHNGYEVHLSVTFENMSVRELAFYHDFAFRTNVEGLYCHLASGSSDQEAGEEEGIDAAIGALARMKGFSPKSMYISPQCIKYGPRHQCEPLNGCREDVYGEVNEWDHFCLGGKTYAFIDGSGNVCVCSNDEKARANLRDHQYNFKAIWQEDGTFRRMREGAITCETARELMSENLEVKVSS